MKRKFLTLLALALCVAASGAMADPSMETLTTAQLERLIFAPAADCEPTVPEPGSDALQLVLACGEADCFDVNDCISQCPSGNNPACVDGVCQYDFSPPSPPSGGHCDEADCFFNSDCYSVCNTSSPQCVNGLCIP